MVPIVTQPARSWVCATLAHVTRSRQHERMRALALIHEAERDTGSIGERITELGFDLEIAFVGGDLPEAGSVDLVVIFGSSESAYDDKVPWLKRELEYVAETAVTSTPIFGICFGGQVLSRVLGGTVSRSLHPETGFVKLTSDDPALVAPGPWMEFHFDRFTLPPGATEVARSEHALQAFTYGRHLGIQFHPEITPRVFDRWMHEWELVGALERFEAMGIAIPAIRAEIVQRADEARAACARLFDAFWERAAPAGR
jgi:GMP synthase (glutamine-hydrolysing)